MAQSQQARQARQARQAWRGWVRNGNRWVGRTKLSDTWPSPGDSLTFEEASGRAFESVAGVAQDDQRVGIQERDRRRCRWVLRSNSSCSEASWTPRT